MICSVVFFLSGHAATASSTAQTRGMLALDSLLSTYWAPKEHYLLKKGRDAAQGDDDLLPYWNYQESLHAVVLGTLRLDRDKYAPWISTFVSGQIAQGGRQGATGKNGWTRPFVECVILVNTAVDFIDHELLVLPYDTVDS